MDDVLTAGDLANELSGAVDNEQPVEDSQNDEQEQENQSEEGQEQEAQEGEQPEGAEGEAQEDQPEAESSEVFLEWESNGEKIRVSQEELKSGYLRQQDYTQKTQNLARESQALQQRVQQEFQQVQAMATEYGQLTSIEQQLQQFGQVNWQGLRESDPLAYAAAMADYNNLRNERENVARQIEGKRQHMTQLQQQNFQKQTEEAKEFLAKEIPNFGPDALNAMRTAGKSLGFSDEFLGGLADGPALLGLWKAAQWDALQAKKPAIQNKVKALPTKATKAAAPAAPQKQVQLDKQLQRLNKSGKTTDFAALLNSLGS